MTGYQPSVIEPFWRARWQAEALDRTPDGRVRPKFYCLDFFPYPSGAGLSVGHCRNYVPTDVVARYRRMRGDAVLHPMGWDAFGLPAENEAIRTGQHPSATVARYAANYRRQLTLIGCSYDWEREISSSAPEYYRWTQWFFLYLFERGLAYRALAAVNWCPSDRTVLAGEEVEDGRCWRCGTPIERRELPQWFFRISAYADRLLEGLQRLDWPQPVVRMQRHWIGRSEGIEFDLVLVDQATLPPLSVYTTRPETIFGATFVALAPEHPFVARITTPDRREAVAAFVEQAGSRLQIERLPRREEQQGIFTGAYARHPLTGALLPVYVATYVLAGHGAWAILAVPAHDQRDYALAASAGLLLLPVIASGEQAETPYTGEGVMINSGVLDGVSSSKARERAMQLLEQRAGGRRRTAYRLRDWLISRQRYWGTPIPIVHCPGCGEVPVPASELPVRLPDAERYQPSGDGRSPLAAMRDWVETACPRCGGAAERETDTLGGFACSSWYYLRFASPHERQWPFDRAAVDYWLPVDLYVGGAEHAVMHLLYARFWTKVLHDGDLIGFDEPFPRLRNQGQVHAADGRRMSKSRGNIVTPDSVVAEHGADALRAYVLFLAPIDQDVTWSERGIRGVCRWLARLWGFVVEEAVTLVAADGTVEATAMQTLRRAVRQVTDDLEGLRFNTMIAALMKLTGALLRARDSGALQGRALQEARETLVRLLAPVAPFLAEELWSRLGHAASVHRQSWPVGAVKTTGEDDVVIAVQVDGRLRDRLPAPVDLSDEAIVQRALALPRVRDALAGRLPQRTVYRPGRVLNLITS